MNVGLARFISRWNGRLLITDLLNDQGNLVIPANTILTTSHLQKIASHRIELTEHHLEQKPVETVDPILKSLEESVSQIESIFRNIRSTSIVPIFEIRQLIVPVIREATTHPRLFDLLSKLQAQDDYTYRHNISVGVIACLLGKWLGLNESELSILTIGATLHDVGKMKIPQEIINKKGRLTAAEYQTMQKHTIFGYQLIKNSAGISHRSALIALQHHEREDGSGYPFRLTGKQIDPRSKIVSVADVFHAMTSRRPYKEAFPLYIILKRMYQGTLGEFDMNILKLFTEKMMNTLVGSEVQLTDGNVAKIVMLNPLDITKPLVQIQGDFIDLSKNSTLNMVQVVG
jgi:HD-GYP domain-containing protein (c-di-GMP phosphodiesterase class II)